MKFRKGLILVITISTLLLSCKSSLPVPARLKCEYTVNPVGLDTPSPRLSWSVSGNNLKTDNLVYRITVASDSAAMARGIYNMWDYSVLEPDKFLVKYGGQKLEPFTRYYWSVQCLDSRNRNTRSPISSFETGPMETSDWHGQWITDVQEEGGNRTPLFRKSFHLEGRIAQARAYVAADSYYELSVNGIATGEHLIDPVCRPAGNKTGYTTFDITAMLTEGENVVAFMAGPAENPDGSTGRACLLADIRVEYSDGRTEVISSGNDWKTVPGPYAFFDIYGSEYYDANLEDPDWNKPGYDDTRWEPAFTATGPQSALFSQRLYPFREAGRESPHKLWNSGDTIYRFDFGKVLDGVSDLRIRGRGGSVVTIRYTDKADTYEAIPAAGWEDLNTLLWPADTIILSGAEDRYRGKLLHTDFRYVEIASSTPLTLTVDNLSVKEIYREIPEGGDISSTDEIIMNQHSRYTGTAGKTFSGNNFPQETGTTGPDCHQLLFPAAVLFNYDAVSLYENWLSRLGNTIPELISRPFSRQSSAYEQSAATTILTSSAMTDIPWLLYLFYGDNHQMERLYLLLKDGVERIEGFTANGLIRSRNAGLFTGFPGLDARFHASTVYYRHVVNLGKIAAALGKTGEAVSFEILAGRIKKALNDEFYNPSSFSYGTGSLLETSTALIYGLVSEENREEVSLRLNNKAMESGLPQTQGYGCGLLLQTLCMNGYHNTAYSIFREHFEDIAEAGGVPFFRLPEPYRTTYAVPAFSRPESSYIEEWFYRCLAGIKIDETRPGFRNIILEPGVTIHIDSFYAEHYSPYGKITSRWETEDNRLIYETRIPAGCTAILRLPESVEGDRREVSLKAGTHRMKFNTN